MLEEFTEESCVVYLRKAVDGFNMVGNPYPFHMRVPDDTLFFLSHEGRVEDFSKVVWDTVSVLNPWNGYWVQCGRDLTRLVFKKSDIIR